MILKESTEYILEYLLNEKEEYSKIEMPEGLEKKKVLIRHLMNVREALPVTNEFLEIQDKYLKEINKSIVNSAELETVVSNSKIAIWQGDITQLKVDAIVNAANNQMLGCFIPGHRCIDNAIHSAAGVQLRLACNEFMQEQGHVEATGSAKITSAYNLPSKYVLHTVGPIITHKVSSEDIDDLMNCYLSCMKLAEDNGVESTAFCCISTGEYRFPNDLAAKIAVKTVENYLEKSTKIKKVIFNVFKDKDYEIYSELLK